jgi:hypothetical protein
MVLKKIIMTIFLFSLLIPSASAIENSFTGYLKLNEINASNISTLPESWYVASKNIEEFKECNVTILYNNKLHSIDYVKEAGQSGELYIGGLYPVIECNLSVELGIDQDNPRSEFYFYTPTAYVIIQRDVSSSYKVGSLWTDDSGVSHSSSFTIPSHEVINNRIHINIQNYESNRTNVVKYNEDLFVASPYRTFSERSLPYHILYPTLLFGEAYVPSGSINVHIYSLTQEIPRHIVTSYGDNKTIGFGLDYPTTSHNKNGVAYMHSNGQVGTVWADVDYNDDDTTAFIKSLLNNGWELGIHFSKPLSAYDKDTAYAIIDNETAIITTRYGRTPTSWCSFQNRDNVTHAVYAYQHHGMYWRNGASGVEWITNIGTLSNVTYDWWDAALNHSATTPVFTHRTDESQEVLYSIDPIKFRSFSDNCKNKKINVCGFVEYYKKGLAQNETNINISEFNATHLKFTLITNGYPCNVNVFTGFVSPEVYKNGSEIPSETVDGGITFKADGNAVYNVSTNVVSPGLAVDGKAESTLSPEDLLPIVKVTVIDFITVSLLLYFAFIGFKRLISRKER